MNWKPVSPEPLTLTQGHIIAEVCDADNESLLDRLGFSDILHTVVSQTMAQCMLVQGARQPQVSV